MQALTHLSVRNAGFKIVQQYSECLSYIKIYAFLICKFIDLQKVYQVWMLCCWMNFEPFRIHKAYLPVAHLFLCFIDMIFLCYETKHRLGWIGFLYAHGLQKSKICRKPVNNELWN